MVLKVPGAVANLNTALTVTWTYAIALNCARGCP